MLHLAKRRNPRMQFRSPAPLKKEKKSLTQGQKSKFSCPGKSNCSSFEVCFSIYTLNCFSLEWPVVLSPPPRFLSFFPN